MTSADLISEQCLQLRELGPKVVEALNKMIATELDQDNVQAEAEYCQLEERYAEIAQQVWSQPVQSWRDIIERAEIAYAYLESDPRTTTCADDMQRRSAFELIRAVLAMAGGPTWRPW